jgi:hypothetical protein
MLTLAAIARAFGDAGHQSKQLTTANQFLSSWAALYTSVLLLTRWFAASITTTDWILLCTSSGAVCAGSLSIRGQVETTVEGYNVSCDESSLFNCDRIDGAILLGGISCLASIAMAIISFIPRANKHMLIPNVGVATVMLLAWFAGICFIVYGGGPGGNFGSIYFNTWLSLILCLDLATTNLCTYLKNRQRRSTEEDQQKDHHEDHDPEERAEDVETEKRKEDALRPNFDEGGDSENVGGPNTGDTETSEPVDGCSGRSAIE